MLGVRWQADRNTEKVGFYHTPPASSNKVRNFTSYSTVHCGLSHSVLIVEFFPEYSDIQKTYLTDWVSLKNAAGPLISPYTIYSFLESLTHGRTHIFLLITRDEIIRPTLITLFATNIFILVQINKTQNCLNYHFWTFSPPSLSSNSYFPGLRESLMTRILTVFF